MGGGQGTQLLQPPHPPLPAPQLPQGLPGFAPLGPVQQRARKDPSLLAMQFLSPHWRSAPVPCPTLPCLEEGPLRESSSKPLGRGSVPVPHSSLSDSTPMLACLPAPLASSDSPGSPPATTQIHLLRPVFRPPQLPLYATASPQIVQFPVSPCSLCTRIYLPSFDCFQASLSLSALLYTNCLPRSCCFQVPPCFPGTQIGLPGFGSFQNPLALSLGSSISPDSAVFRLPSLALYTDRSPRFCSFQAPLFPLYTDQPLAYVDPSCLRDSVGLRGWKENTSQKVEEEKDCHQGSSLFLL